MSQQKKKTLLTATVSILVIVLIVALIVGINLKEKKLTVNNGPNTESDSEHDLNVSTEENTEEVQEIETEEFIETESEDESTKKEETEIVVPPTSESTEPEKPRPQWTVSDMNKTMYAKSWVNVRTGPGTEYDKLGSLSSNQEVIVTGKCNEYNWYRINYNENEAYVSCDYLLNEKVVNNTNTNNNVNNNTGNMNSSNNSENVEEPEESEEEEEIVKVPTTPEPEWGTFKYEKPNDGWNYMPVDVWDHWNSENNGWTREVRQTTMWNKEQDGWDVYEVTIKAYPLREDNGTEGQTIEYPILWVYFGDGPIYQ